MEALGSQTDCGLVQPLKGMVTLDLQLLLSLESDRDILNHNLAACLALQDTKTSQEFQVRRNSGSHGFTPFQKIESTTGTAKIRQAFRKMCDL